MHSWQTGVLHSFRSRPINHRHFLFPVPKSPSQLKILIKIQSDSTISIPLKLWNREIFDRNDARELLLHGVFFGVMLIMIAYNIIMASALKSLSGYYYAIYMLSFALFNFVAEGFLYQYFPILEGWIQRTPSALSVSAMTMAALFASRFLNVTSENQKIRRAILAFIAFGSITFCIVVFGNYRLGLRMAYLCAFIGPTVLLVLGFIRLAQGFRPARYFVFGFGFVIFTTLIYGLSRLGFIPMDNLFVAHCSQFGGALEATLLSFGLADRIRLLQKEKELAQAATIEQQRVLNEAFARFVPTPFLQMLGKKSIPEVLLGDYTEREMTILFADIRGFTTISEKLSPKQTFEFINNYLQGSGPVIRNNGGFIDKYMGDGIMALFERRENAINAALRLQSRNARLNRMLGQPPPPPPHLTQGRDTEGDVQSQKGLVAPIHVGIGIHTGHLMLGTIGEPQRMDGTVISDAVNLASRVESLTKQYGVDLLVTKETLLGINLGTSEFPWIRRFIDRVAVKGKNEPATIYELIALKNGKAIKYSKKWLLAWNKAMRLFYAREFMAARQLLSRLLAKSPDDKTAMIFHSRSDEYVLNPPPIAWDGVAIARNK